MPLRVDWRPGASLELLERQADLRRRVRAYFDRSGSLEVVTPVLSHAGPTEPAIEPFCTPVSPHDQARRLWLQTSPEFAMKRLVAAYGRDIWQLCPVFRRDEAGVRHNVEFQLLEWYRVGQDAPALMRDVAGLLRAAAGESPPFDTEPVEQRYGVLVRQATGRWPEQLAVDDVRGHFAAAERHFPAGIDESDTDAALDLLLDTFVLPTLPLDRPTFIVDYPPSQASLARLTTDADGRQVAARFELYAGPVELANGFHELVDAAEQRARFEAERAQRRAAGQPVPPLDERFLAALEHGLPACAGVALGIERLAMVAFGAPSLDAVQSLSGARA